MFDNVIVKIKYLGGINMLNVNKEMEIHNVEVYGLHQSIVASGYAMSDDVTPPDFLEGIEDGVGAFTYDNDYKRAKQLGRRPTNSGHPCYLKGVIVQFDLKAPEYIWRQMDRYHFIDFVTSQSKMHCLPKFELDKMVNKWVSPVVLTEVKKYINWYNNFDEAKEKFKYLQLADGSLVDFTKKNLYNMIVSNCPCGLLMTARMTTNYLQLANIRNQRKMHKMDEWHYFDQWISDLPLFDELTGTKCEYPLLKRNEKGVLTK